MYLDRWSGTWPSRADVASPGNARMRKRFLVINVFGEGNKPKKITSGMSGAHEGPE